MVIDRCDGRIEGWIGLCCRDKGKPPIFRAVIGEEHVYTQKSTDCSISDHPRGYINNVWYLFFLRGIALLKLDLDLPLKNFIIRRYCIGPIRFKNKSEQICFVVQNWKKAMPPTLEGQYICPCLRLPSPTLRFDFLFCKDRKMLLGELLCL